MAPTPCKHCGMNFMPPDSSEIDYELCHNCKIRERTRTPKIEKKNMAIITILVTLPSHIHKEIEENCLAKNTDFNQYFLDLYNLNCAKTSQAPTNSCVKIQQNKEESSFIQDIDDYVAPEPTKVKPAKTKIKTKGKK